MLLLFFWIFSTLILELDAFRTLKRIPILSFNRGGVARPIPSIPFQRKKLAVPPRFNKIIGNLLHTKEQIENDLIQLQALGEPNKEGMPYLCLVNTPRAGKSLLIDQIFSSSSNFTVIPVSYNSETSFRIEEIEDVPTAFKYFCGRLFLAISGVRMDLNDVIELYGDHLYSLRSLRALLKDRGFTDPFAQNKSILICLDEFSVFVDAIRQRWSYDQIKSFQASLQSVKSPVFPLVQILVTGFNQNMTHLLASNSPVRNYYLPQCTWNQSIPLVKIIYQEYKQHNERFPFILSEMLSSTPGLLGQWAEFVHRKLFPDALVSFAARVPWLDYIVSNEIHGNNSLSIIETNFRLILEYLLTQEINLKKRVSLRNELITATLVTEINDKQMVELVPVCLAWISQNYQPGSLLFSVLNEEMLSLIRVIEAYDDKREKEGWFYEKYVENLYLFKFRLRQVHQQFYQVNPLYLTKGLQELPNNYFDSFYERTIKEEENTISISLKELTRTSKVFNCETINKDMQYSLYIPEGKELSNLFLDVFQKMFPFGIHAYEDNIVHE
jgi:hypothetical protein